MVAFLEMGGCLQNMLNVGRPYDSTPGLPEMPYVYLFN